MKLRELQKKFQNKYAVKMIAGILVFAMMGTSFAAGYMQGSTNQALEAQAAVGR